MKKQNVDNLVEQIQVQGKLTGIRSYPIGDHLEFRFPYVDAATGRRRFKCCRTIEEARAAALKINAQPESGLIMGGANAQARIVQEAVRRAVEALGQNSASVAPPAPVEATTFSDVADRFLADKEMAMTRGELRYVSYRDLLTRTAHLKKLLGSLLTTALPVGLLDTAIRSLPAQSPRSVWNYRTTLRSILIWARDRNLAPANVLQAFKAMSAKGDPRKDADKIDPFSVEETDTILHACLEGRRSKDYRNHRLAAACALQAFTGLRARESCVLDWGSIDLKSRLIRVKADGSKRRKNRTTTLTENARAWLEMVPYQLRRGPVYPGNYWDSMAWAKKRAVSIMPGFRWRNIPASAC